MAADLSELVALPDIQKQHLAHDLLVELGATNIRRHGDELIHGCLTCTHHTDQSKNPTAALNWSKLLVNCLSGGGGSVLWLIATVRGCTIEQARAWLAGEAGLNQVMELPKLLALFDSLYTKTRPEPMPHYSERILQPWLENGFPEYATKRGIPDTTAIRTMICTAPPNSLGGKHSGPRMVIPHWWQGRLVGWQSRRLDERDGTPKYLSSPAFPADNTLYMPYATGRHRAVVVESPTTALRHAHHHPVIATFGAEITDHQLALLSNYEEVIFWLDNDTAGWNCVESYTDSKGKSHTGAAEKLSRTTKVSVVESPYTADPGDLDDRITDALIEGAVPWPIWQRPTTASLLCHRCRKAHPDRKHCQF